MAEIIPAILTDSLETLKKNLTVVEPFAELVQIDIGDGHFVSTKTIAPALLKENAPHIRYDVHLMVQNPRQAIEELYDAPNLNRFIFHVEAIQFPTAEIEHAHGYDREVLIAVNPETPLEDIEGYVYQADGVLFLSVHPGLQGQAILPEVIEKIARFKDAHPTVRVGVDGGIKKEHIARLKQIGVDEICVGSAIFAALDPAQALQEFQKLAA